MVDHNNWNYEVEIKRLARMIQDERAENFKLAHHIDTLTAQILTLKKCLGLDVSSPIDEALSSGKNNVLCDDHAKGSAKAHK